MGSIFGSADRPAEDLTARARIRDAALAQFAEHGTKGATMRGIADAAGVSLGLVQHHFGTKDALRDACDEAVIEVFRRRLTDSATTNSLGEPGFLTDLFETSGLLLRYLARAMIDGSPAAANVFDELAGGTADFLSHTWPDRFPPGSARARDAASVMAAMHSGTVLLHEQLARHFGDDPLDREHATRIGMAMFDVYASIGEFTTSPAGQRIKESTAKYRDHMGGQA
ncbi:transcriptional regulator, TetR family [Amycolatopsis marina]|uniref:Transcriptional regulator, TetR family n=1 Tax=Amycolatopsis marina TaxID=490629 RepID=A0A1I1BJ39_9PSEU|nr:TetR/AcrR family transcriptional regulator [Amycolatopsis marina]SFB49772.1 transcriptional regulator, TetR family [Amycolatopsis marina]